MCINSLSLLFILPFVILSFITWILYASNSFSIYFCDKFNRLY